MTKREEIIADTVRALKDGKVILYPTDTVWGIGCDATNPEAVKRVYEIKHRADSKSLVLLAADLDMVARFVRQIPDIAIDLVEVNDAPMTIIYPGAIAAAEGAPSDRHYLAANTVAADGTVGIRVPLVDFCREMVSKLGRPIVSTSANISGEPTPSSFAEISEEIVSSVDYVMDKSLERESTGRASQIIKVGLGGEVVVIRP